MTQAVHHGAHLGHGMPHAGRGLVLDHQHRLDGVLRVGGEVPRHRFRIHGAPLRSRHRLDLQPVVLRAGRPAVGEEPRLGNQHLVPGREEVRDARVPGAVAGGRVGDDEALPGLQDRLHPLERSVAQRHELGPGEVDRRPLHGLEDPVRDVGGTGMHEELPAACDAHRLLRGSVFMMIPAGTPRSPRQPPAAGRDAACGPRRAR